MADLARHRASSKRRGAADRTLRCPTCQYALTGLPANRCPECGAEFDPVRLAALQALPRPRVVWTVAGAVALFGAAYLHILTGRPAPYGVLADFIILAPLLLLPLPVVPHTIAYACIPALFVLANAHLLRGAPRIPLRSAALAALIIALSAVMIGAGWPPASHAGPSSPVWIALGANAIGGATLTALWAYNRRRPAYWSNLAFHMLGFYCLAHVWLPLTGDMTL